MIAPTTPTGSRTTSELPISSSHGTWATTWGIELNVIVGRPAWIIRDRPIGIPSSAATVAAISSARAASPSPIAASSSTRSPTGVCDQPSNASRAAPTARSTSSAVPWGMRPITSSVLALTTSSVSEPDGATHAPPT